MPEQADQTMLQPFALLSNQVSLAFTGRQHNVRIALPPIRLMVLAKPCTPFSTTYSSQLFRGLEGKITVSDRVDIEIDMIAKFAFEKSLQPLAAVIPTWGLMVYHGLVVAELGTRQNPAATEGLYISQSATSTRLGQTDLALITPMCICVGESP